VKEFIYLGTTLAYKYYIQEKNKEQVKIRECLLSFGAESFVVQVAIQKYKH
jgi:hypothetical protein